MIKITRQLYKKIKLFPYIHAFRIQHDKDNNAGTLFFKFLKNDMDLFLGCKNFRTATPLLPMFFYDYQLSILHQTGIDDGVIAKTYDSSYNPNDDATIDATEYPAATNDEVIIEIPFELVD